MQYKNKVKRRTLKVTGDFKTELHIHVHLI
jgi:hypothetical protein